MKPALLLLVVLSSLTSQPLLADTARGAQLEQEHCTGCHAARFGGDESAIYLRQNRRVNSYQRLLSQVRFCENNLGLTWFDDQIADVADYLDQNYYHFTPAK